MLRDDPKAKKNKVRKTGYQRRINSHIMCANKTKIAATLCKRNNKERVSKVPSLDPQDSGVGAIF